MNNPLVSIIIPVFNCEAYLAETINSALSQTWLNTELIIVNDGSTDASSNIAAEFVGEKVKVISQRNRGASAARNRGLSVAKGDYIQFLDADDLMASNKIEMQLNILRAHPNAVIGCNWIRFRDTLDQTIGLAGPEESIRRSLDPTEWLLLRKMMPVHAWLTPLSVISRAGIWNEEISTNDDGEFFYRVVSTSSKVLYAKDATVYYRTEKDHSGISVLNSPIKAVSLYKSALTYKKIIRQLNTNPIESNAAIGNFFKELEYIFYPTFPDLVRLCNMHQELRHANVPYRYGKMSSLSSRLIGWKATKWIRAYLTSCSRMPSKDTCEAPKKI